MLAPANMQFYAIRSEHRNTLFRGLQLINPLAYIYIDFDNIYLSVFRVYICPKTHNLPFQKPYIAPSPDPDYGPNPEYGSGL